jgi:hypothetical protein
MKNILLLFCLAIAVLLSATPLMAQEADKGSVFVVSVFTIDTQHDGSMSELDSLARMYADKVVRPNEKILSQKNMHHLYGSDQRDYVVITEYASWSDIEAATKRSGELIEQAWPDKDDRKAFFKAMTSYFLTHSDEIYKGIPHLDK